MSEINTPAHQLPAGTLLNYKYEIIHTIGEGGFGITYMGRNTVLDIPVAIKEYYPHGYANRSVAHDLTVTITDTTKNSYFSKWKEKFLSEARTLAKFSNIPNIVNVLDFFEQNGTAYIVMEYLNGITLSDYVSRNGVFNADRLCRIMIPMLRSLNKIHQKKLIHRDISPDNIMVMPDGSLKLFDFGAARDYSETTQRSLSVMLKPGFAPEEQYRSRGLQGPWTDVYATCATMYFCITGIKPDDSIQRVFSDELKPPSELGICISPQIEEAILMGMSVKSEDRFRTAEALATAFERGLSVSEQTAPSNPVIKLLRRHPKADKKTNSLEEHTEIVRTEVKISEDNTKKKITFLDIMRKIAAKLNIKIVGGVTLGLFIFGTILTSTLVDKEMHRGDYTNYSSDEWSSPDFTTVSIPSLIPENSSSGKFEVSSLSENIDNSSLITDSSSTSKSDGNSDSTSSAKDRTHGGIHGTWNGTTYTSEFLGVRCVLDSSWNITADAELAADFGGSDMSEESIKAALDSGNGVIEMEVKSAYGNINIIIEDTQITKNPTGDKYFEIAPGQVKQYLDERFGVNTKVTETTVNFCGENVRGIATLLDTGNVSIYQLQVPIFINDYLAGITFSASDQKIVDELVKTFYKLDDPDSNSESSAPTSSSEETTAISLCGTWNGTTYISDFLGIKCVLDSNWYVMTDEYLASTFGESDISEESIKVALGSSGFATVMGAINMKNAGNVTIVMVDTKITNTPTGDMYFKVKPDILKRDFEKEFGTDVEVAVINVNFCGENTRGIATIANVDNLTHYQIQVPVFKGNYMGSILFSANNRQDAEELIKWFSKL